jgi:imidazolonepropionase-like amidohydrolase
VQQIGNWPLRIADNRRMPKSHTLRLLPWLAATLLMASPPLHAADATASTPATAPSAAAQSMITVLRAQRLLAAPDAAPVDDAVVLMRGGRILAAGARADVAVPEGARDLGCSGGVVTAGFQNSHAHFTGSAWSGAATRDAASLSAALTEMLLRHGVTTVVDTSSDPRDVLPLRERIRSGALPGPRILTVGAALYPPDGLPFYLAFLPKPVRDALPQPASPEEAVAVVRSNLAAGADGTKLFIATPQADRSVRAMPAAVARAAADETHRQGKLVMAHPTNIDGLRGALAAGVDVLVHTTLGMPDPWPTPLVAELVARKTSLVPTLKLWYFELAKTSLPQPVRQALVEATQQQLKQYADAGGQVLFGTDVGYMTDFDPTDEYRLMAGAGLTPRQILASLTTAPAARWNETAQRGRIAAGQDADLVVLGSDPLADAARFSDVRCTIRGGALLYSR